MNDQVIDPGPGASPEAVPKMEPLSPHIGAEIHGVDLSRSLSGAAVEALRHALLTHQVIFFRDQELSPDQQKAFARRFGDLHVHPAAPGRLADHPEVLVMNADESSTSVAGEQWHSDVSCDPQPPMGSILHMLELPPVGGDTLFASMYAAYQALSDVMQRFLDGLTALHESEHVYRGRYGVADDRKVFPRAEHPVIRTHPESGRKGLFVNRTFTTRIKQLGPTESAAVLQLLYSHLESPEFHCRFRWTEKAIAFWDNRCTQHRALWDYRPGRRRAHRVTIGGTPPF